MTQLEKDYKDLLSLFEKSRKVIKLQQSRIAKLTEENRKLKEMLNSQK